MTPILPPLAPLGSVRVVFGAGQPHVDPLPAMVAPDGTVLTAWEPPDEERRHLSEGGHIYLWIWPCGQPLQPIAIETDLGLAPEPTSVTGSIALTGQEAGIVAALRAGQQGPAGEKGTGALHDAVTALGTIGQEPQA